jgi:hypothetical protein
MITRACKASPAWMRIGAVAGIAVDEATGVDPIEA